MRRDSPLFSAWFWEQVQKGGDDECWLWRGQYHGYRPSRSYGVLSVYAGPYGQTALLAHRVAYELTHGAIPKGRCVLHRCDNRPCCNPTHLFIGAKGDNIRDAVRKGRALVGEKNPYALLTSEQVREIKTRHRGTYGDGAALAREFGVSRSTISKIVRGTNWPHIT